MVIVRDRRHDNRNLTELINVFISSARVRGFQVIFAVAQRRDWSTQESYGEVQSTGSSSKAKIRGTVQLEVSVPWRWTKAIKALTEQRVK